MYPTSYRWPPVKSVQLGARKTFCNPFVAAFSIWSSQLTTNWCPTLHFPNIYAFFNKALRSRERPLFILLHILSKFCCRYILKDAVAFYIYSMFAKFTCRLILSFFWKFRVLPNYCDIFPICRSNHIGTTDLLTIDGYCSRFFDVRKTASQADYLHKKTLTIIQSRSIIKVVHQSNALTYRSRRAPANMDTANLIWHRTKNGYWLSLLQKALLCFEAICFNIQENKQKHFATYITVCYFSWPRLNTEAFCIFLLNPLFSLANTPWTGSW